MLRIEHRDVLATGSKITIMNNITKYTETKGLTSYPKLAGTLEKITQLLGVENKSATWLVGGSCGLWLQGVSLAAAPRDIDIYADTEDARTLHQILKFASTDEPEFDCTGFYVSLLSHYMLDDYSVELVGGFEVHSRDSRYKVQVKETLASEAPQIIPRLRLMPLAHEMLFNLLREREDRYVPIAETIRAQIDLHLPLLRKMLTCSSNHWDSKLISNLTELLGVPSLQVWANNK